MLKFCGDALIILWSTGDRRRDACMATIAAFQLQDRAGTFEISVSVVLAGRIQYCTTFLRSCAPPSRIKNHMWPFLF